MEVQPQYSAPETKLIKYRPRLSATNISNLIDEISYTNPLTEFEFADPSEPIRGKDGKFYMVATQSNKIDGTGNPIEGIMDNLTMISSYDLLHWTREADPLPNKPPEASDFQDIWAPNWKQRSSDGKIVVVFAARLNVKEDEVDKNGNPIFKTGIFSAVSVHPGDPTSFENTKLMLEGYPGFYMIDPKIEEMDGREHLIVGSAHVIKGMYDNNEAIVAYELQSDLQTINNESEPIRLLEPVEGDYDKYLVEAAEFKKHNGKPYALVSGPNVFVRYGIMKAFPASDKQLDRYRLPENDYLLIDQTINFHRIGHHSSFKDARGKDWIVAHGTRKDSSNQTLRQLVMFPLDFDENSKPDISLESLMNLPQRPPRTHELKRVTIADFTKKKLANY
ncbi:MAG TPA: family 43 glycosylhydrolase [Candidatus Nitrosocosmicus sp.]|nr:family 43 glycosylhydrolase [Candidatus Nitrosocosmicus sp.]